MLMGIAIGEFISLVLFFALSDETAARGLQVLVDLARALTASTVVLIALSLGHPSPTWEARMIIFGIGLLAVAIQVAFELRRNEGFRDLIFKQGSGAGASEI